MYIFLHCPRGQYYILIQSYKMTGLYEKILIYLFIYHAHLNIQHCVHWASISYNDLQFHIFLVIYRYNVPIMFILYMHLFVNYKIDLIIHTVYWYTAGIISTNL